MTTATNLGFSRMGRKILASFRAGELQTAEMDEPALREGLPLYRADWPEYL